MTEKRLVTSIGRGWRVLTCLILLAIGAAGLARTQHSSAASGLPTFQMDLSLPDRIVTNADQGLGQCHWVDPGIIGRSYVAWAYDTAPPSAGWATLEPQAGTYNWAPVDREIGKARSAGKRIWLSIHTTEGQAPQWARDAGVELVGSNGVPAPWNSTYQLLLRRVVHEMAARYDGHPYVDAIVVAAGGCYGEMTICNEEKDTATWEAAGYTDDRFAEAVRRIIDIYLEQDYVWPDGHHSHGFVETPVVLQIGTGLYGHGAAREPVVGYAMSTYGMRVWLKYNGLGDGNRNYAGMYATYNTVTRVGLEPVGNQVDFLNNPSDYVRVALDDHSSFLCLQDAYYSISNQTWQDAFRLAARYLGSQIVIQGVEAPDSIRQGESLVIVSNWVNRGTVPLMYGQRRGVKDIPASYEVEISLVDPSTGEAVLVDRFIPATPTTVWYSARRVRVERILQIPGNLPQGEYDLRLALVHPGTTDADPKHRYRLVNADLHDGQGRYTLDWVRVLSSDGTAPPLPTRTPSPTRTRTPVSTATPVGTAPYPPTASATRTASATPTASATALPPGTDGVVTLQQGSDGYGGCEDTYFYEYAPEQNLCQADVLKVGFRQRYATLLRFDLSPLPAGAIVTRATLQLWAKGWGGVDATFQAFRVRRSSDVCAATWRMADKSTPWGQPGCEDEVVDRWPWAESSVKTNSIRKWYDFDVSNLAQEWVAGTMTNNGVILVGEKAWADGEFHFASSQDRDLDARPRLVVYYRLPQDPVSSQTTTSTPTGTAMPEASATSASPTPSSTAVLPPPPTPTATRTPTETRRPSATPTLTLTVPAPGSPVTVVLQQGLAGYAGCVDTYFYQYGVGQVHCHDDALRVGYKQRYAALLRFDLADLPAGAIVTHAALELYAKGWGGLDMTLEAFRLTRGFEACSASWDLARAGVPWGLPGCADVATDRSGEPEATLRTNSIWKWYALDVTSAARSWVDGSSANRGLLLRGGSSTETGLFYFASTEDGGVDYRPRLVVTYHLPVGGVPTSTATPVPTATSSSTATPSATSTGEANPSFTPTTTVSAPPTATPTTTATASATATATATATVPATGASQTVVLQLGREGYRGYADTWIYEYTPDSGNCWDGALKVGYKQRNVALLRFDLSSIPTGARVTHATLEAYAKGWGGAAATIEVFRLLRPFVACECTWRRAEASVPWGATGASLEGIDRAASAEDSVELRSIWRWYAWDTTSAVQAWVSGDTPAYGLLLRNLPNWATGVFYFASGEDAAIELRPRLTITYAVP